MITLLLIAIAVPFIGVMLFMWHCKEYGNVPDFDVVLGWLFIILFMEWMIINKIASY